MFPPPFQQLNLKTQLGTCFVFILHNTLPTMTLDTF
jgi:hypothetical protein